MLFDNKQHTEITHRHYFDYHIGLQVNHMHQLLRMLCDRLCLLKSYMSNFMLHSMELSSFLQWKLKRYKNHVIALFVSRPTNTPHRTMICDFFFLLCFLYMLLAKCVLYLICLHQYKNEKPRLNVYESECAEYGTSS